MDFTSGISVQVRESKDHSSISFSTLGFNFIVNLIDLNNPQWSYMLALERGWIPKGNLNDPSITNACEREDQGAFVCECNRDALDSTIKNGLGYALGEEDKDAKYLDGMSGDELYDEADEIFDEFWQSHRAIGATCDFGGAAKLAEVNVTHSEDYYNTDDYYNVVSFVSANTFRCFYSVQNVFNLDYIFFSCCHVKYEINEFPIWKIILFSVAGVIIGGGAGFTVAMKTSTKFNRAVRSSTMLRPITSTQTFRRSFGNLIDVGYGEVPGERAPTF